MNSVKGKNHVREDADGLPENALSDRDLLNYVLTIYGGVQKELATFLGRPESTISNWLQDEDPRAIPSHTRRLLELAFGLHPPLLPYTGGGGQPMPSPLLEATAQIREVFFRYGADSNEWRILKSAIDAAMPVSALGKKAPRVLRVIPPEGETGTR